MQKRVMAINDISCFGKCSLTVALPILSAAGLEACPVPTALLSTHTGGFSDYTFKNLDDQILPICKHWKKEGISFDSIYSGYLGSYEQIETVKSIIDDFSDYNVKVLIDPVMGDNGKLYAGFEEHFAEGMFELCKKADIIVPNITEACYMLNIKYKEEFSEDEIIEFARKFNKEGIHNAVITGIRLSTNTVSCAICKNGNCSFIKNDLIGGMYHGTGDVFASALLSAILSGKELDIATNIAVNFVRKCILLTKSRYGDSHYGVDFEDLLSDFIDEIRN